MDPLRQALERVVARWSALQPSQRLVLGSLVVGAVLTLVVGALVFGRPQYAVLYTGLDPEQARAAVQKLQDLGVRFELDQGGTTIRVPENKLYAMRLELATEVPLGVKPAGLEEIEPGRFGPTQFEQRVIYQRALQGELVRTIRAMNEVRTAFVHLNIPERKIFVDGADRASASVTLQLRPGVQLSRKQIAGIRALVAGSVEGLLPENVAVLDGDMRELAGPSTSLGEGMDVIHEAEVAYARELQEKAARILDHVVGPGHGVVSVVATLERERLEKESETWSPDGRVRSSQTTENPDGGSSEIQNLELDKVVERLRRDPGNIKRLSVSVTVDGRYEENDGGERVFVERSADELQKYADAIRTAVGIEEGRGDRFSITCVPFEHDPGEAQRALLKKVEQRQMITQLVIKGLQVLAAVALLLLVLRALRLAAKTLQAPPPAPAGRAPAGDAAAALAAGAEPSAAAAPANPVRTRITAMTRDRPEESAALIRAMLEEE